MYKMFKCVYASKSARACVCRVGVMALRRAYAVLMYVFV